MTFRWRKVVHKIKDMSCQLKKELGVIWKSRGVWTRKHRRKREEKKEAAFQVLREVKDGEEKVGEEKERKKGKKRAMRLF